MSANVNNTFRLFKTHFFTNSTLEYKNWILWQENSLPFVPPMTYTDMNIEHRSDMNHYNRWKSFGNNEKIKGVGSKVVNNTYSMHCIYEHTCTDVCVQKNYNSLFQSQLCKVHIFWEGHKILQNLPLTFDWHYIGQK